jgi:7-keto-8-aminopelargonate synthetase-like enzyme
VTSTAQAFIERRLKAVRRRHLFRQLTPLDHGTTAWITIGERRLLNLSSNNYLGLADHPRLKEAAIAAIRDYGCGTGASRLVTGTTRLHELLEQRLAAFKGCEQALLFSSGYHANMGVISSFVGPGDVVLSDELNHASIIDGIRIASAARPTGAASRAGAECKVYPHCDIIALAQQLEELDRADHRGLRLVVTDSVFSMDGDIAPLAEITRLCERHDALLVVDEAHATGCLGPGGRGLVAEMGEHKTQSRYVPLSEAAQGGSAQGGSEQGGSEQGGSEQGGSEQGGSEQGGSEQGGSAQGTTPTVADQIVISVNTLSKAFGVFGAFVAGSSLVKEFLTNVARQFIFTTALPPADVAACLAALDILEEDPELPTRLQQKAAFLRTGLRALGFQTLTSETQIIPILIGDSTRALQMAQALRERGVYAVAIRPPTVPMGSARMRFSVMASHTEEDLAFALEVTEKVGKEMGVIE